MKRLRARAVLLFLAVLVPAGLVNASPAPVGAAGDVPMSAADFRAELGRLIQVADGALDHPQEVAAVATALPPEWDLRLQRQRFQVKTAWLRDELRALARRPEAAARDRVRSHLFQMRTDLDAFENPPRDVRVERSAMTRILAGREFRGVRGPGWWDDLRQRVMALLVGLLQRIFGSSTFPVVTRLIVYALVGLAIVVAGLLASRILRKAGTPDRLAPEHAPVSAKPWSAWLSEARQAAAAADWREAVRLAYWCAISLLESQRVWPPDRARTPREYLRLLPTSSEHRPALASLTGTFEMVWYARQEASAETFARALADVGNLGCPDASRGVACR